MAGDDHFVSQSTTPGEKRERWTKFSDIAFSGISTITDEGYGSQGDFTQLYLRKFQDTLIGKSSSATSEREESDAGTCYVSNVTNEQEIFVSDQELETDVDRVELAVDHPLSKNIVVDLPLSTLNNPRSMYDGFDPGAPVAKEYEAVDMLLAVLKQAASEFDDFIEFELNDFTIYIDNNLYPNEIRPLHHLATRAASDKFYFDGIISIGETRYFIKRIPFRELPIGNYCDITEHTVGDQIWIRSELNRNEEIYYKLKSSAPEYDRFWRPFLWIADLSKHIVDYCLHLLGKKHRARLDDFRENFSNYLKRRHGKSDIFERWHASHGSTDFRTAIVANIDFIWKEALGLPQIYRRIATNHDVWAEIKGVYYKPMIPPQFPSREESMAEDSATSETTTTGSRKIKDTQAITKTIVTPYIFNLFNHMGFDNIIKSMEPTEAAKSAHLQQVQKTCCVQPTIFQGSNRTRNDPDFLAKIELGDVISTPPDSEDTGTKWKQELSRHHVPGYVWYGTVQEVHISSGGRRSFDVIWMYQPRDTPCALMKYPWPNELFLSDSCTCEIARVDEQDVLATHKVAWYGEPASTLPTDFFVRQTYLAGERCWVALDKNHMVCSHHKKNKQKSAYFMFKQGDTVLAKLPESSRLDAFIVESICQEHLQHSARLRILLRRGELEPAGGFPANELVYSDRIIEIELGRIVRRCIIRTFGLDEDIPAPYSRAGTGDAFYITHRVLPEEQNYIVPFENQDHFRQGFKPGNTASSMKLRGLDLFCGGGNFGRGIEDGGGVVMKWANDISSNAIHSYMANSHPDNCTPFLGSVDDLFERALSGRHDVPQPGYVQFVSGGSPCQGFSRLTKVEHQKTIKQWKNRSLVASFASFVDFYRPQYGLLENVPSMVKSHDKREECFFSQLACSIVGLGYQVRIIYADAWSYGAPQSRCRVFLSFAAPAVPMPKAPSLTHSHPPETRMGSLGKMSNGQPFGDRVNDPVPFKFVSSSEAADDLPDIRDGKADYCVGFPDHRIPIGFTPRIRNQIRLIPTQPFGLSYNKAQFGYDDNGKRVSGTISEADRDYYFPNSEEFRMRPGTKGWGRVHPHGLFRTVVTVCGPTDRLTGTVNHWQQPRPLTVLEVRRAQGFLDHEVITGRPAQQWHVVGNSVARQVALTLGLMIREAWFGTLYDDSCPELDAARETNELSEANDILRKRHVSEVEENSEDREIPFNDQAQNSFSNDNRDPISTPTTSVRDQLEELSNLENKYFRKHGETQIDILNLPAKRSRLDMDVI